MATTIQIKRSTGSSAPTTTDLVEGELAYAEDRTGDGAAAKLYIESVDSGSNQVIHAIGGKFYTDAVDAATNLNTASAIVKRDGSGNFTAGTITADLTGDVTGDVTGNADTATAWATARDLSLTGDATATLSSVDGSANVSAGVTLATVNSNTGSFGSTTAVPVITVNGKGLITAVSTASIATSFDISDGTATDTVNGGESLVFDGGTGVTTSVTNNQVSFAIGQSVGTSDNVTFADVTATGDLAVSGSATVSTNLTVTGDLTVNGTTTTVNTTNLDVTDPLFKLASGNDSSDSVDIGFYGLYDTTGSQDLYAGLFRDAGDGKWKLFKDSQSAPTTTVDTGATGYTVATLVANLEGNVTGNVTGQVSDISNFDTDDLAEGATNIYWTNTRFDNRLASATIDGGTY